MTMYFRIFRPESRSQAVGPVLVTSYYKVYDPPRNLLVREKIDAGLETLTNHLWQERDGSASTSGDRPRKGGLDSKRTKTSAGVGCGGCGTVQWGGESE